MDLHFLEWAVVAVDLVAVGVMLIGFVIALVKFVPTLTRRQGAGTIRTIHLIRCSLGTYILLALEIMIVSDLIHSVMTHELRDLYYLGALVVIRTLIAYFLNKEIQELEKEAGATS
jgi:uncharacterized membrane protein